VAVRVTEWGDFSVNIRVWVWAVDSPTAFVMGCDLMELLKKRFEKEGIEIPYPYRNVVMQTEEDKTTAPPINLSQALLPQLR